MYYLVNVDHKGMECISPEVIMMGYKKCYISNAVNVPDDMLWSGSEEDGNNRSVRKVKVL